MYGIEILLFSELMLRSTVQGLRAALVLAKAARFAVLDGAATPPFDTADGNLQAFEPVDTAVMAKTSLHSPDLHRLFVSVPHLGGTIAKVLVFKPQ
jgi:hypothetical protein